MSVYTPPHSPNSHRNEQILNTNPVSTNRIWYRVCFGWATDNFFLILLTAQPQAAIYPSKKSHALIKNREKPSTAEPFKHSYFIIYYVNWDFVNKI